MSLVYCPVAASLVGPKYWLPTEPFDYGWGSIGCDQLRCGKCGQQVQARLDAARFCRHYECACQSRDEYSYHVIGSDAGDDALQNLQNIGKAAARAVTRWRKEHFELFDRAVRSPGVITDPAACFERSSAGYLFNSARFGP